MRRVIATSGKVSKMFTLTPFPGRDYKSKAQIEADFAADKDFVANNFNGDSTYINRPQLIELGLKTVNVRYGNLRKVTVIKVK